MAKSILPLLLLCLYLSQGNAQLSKTYQNCKIMSEARPYYFHWTLTPTHIEVAVQAPAGRGWIALGFVAPGVTNELMVSDGEGTDVALGYLREDDANCPQGCIRDYWVVARVSPPRDAIQNVEFVAASRDSTTGLVTLEWKRPLATNDTSRDRVLDPSQPMNINWAMNNGSNAIQNDGLTIQKHPSNSRGSILINLSEPSSCEAAPQAQTTSFKNTEGTYSAEWTIDDAAKEITVTFRGKTRTGWVGFAFDQDGLMPDHDSYVGWVDSNGIATLVDRHTSGRVQPLSDVDSGGTNDILSFTGGVVQIDGAEWLQFTFTRKLQTDDQFDLDLEPGKPGFLLWALGPNNGVNYAAGTFEYHANRGSAQIDFFGGCATVARPTDLRKVHGILMVIAWCALLFTGSFFSRYLKIVTTAWFKIHVALQTVGVAVVLAAFIIIFIAQGSFNLGAHQVIGLIIFGLAMAQPFIGLIADRLFDPSRSKVPAQDQIHWWVGRFLLLLSVVNIFLGIDRLFPISNGAYILYALFAAWTALSIAILIAQEVRVGGAEESDVIDLNGGDAKLINNEDTKQKSKIAKSTFVSWIVLQISILTVFLVFIGISPTDGSNTFTTEPANCP